MTYGTPAERLEIFRQAKNDVVKVGVPVFVKYRPDLDMLMIGIPHTGICADCGQWIYGHGDGCPYCNGEISGTEKPVLDTD